MREWFRDNGLLLAGCSSLVAFAVMGISGIHAWLVDDPLYSHDAGRAMIYLGLALIQLGQGYQRQLRI